MSRTNTHPSPARRLAIAAVVALLPVTLAACGGGDDGSSTPGVSDDVITIGMSSGLTGPAASIVQPIVDGIELHFAEVNEAGGVQGRRVELETVDDAYDVTRAVSNTREFVAEDQVFGLVGFGTAPVSAVTSMTCDKGVAMIFLAAVKAQGSCFRMYPGPGAMLTATVNYLVETHGPEVLDRVALYAQNDDYGDGGEEAVKAIADKYGSEWKRFTVEAGATDAASQAKQIKDFKPTVILSATLSNPTALLLNALRDADVKIGEGGAYFGGTDTVDAQVVKLAGAAAQGAVGASSVLDINDTSDPSIASFVAAHDKLDPDGSTTNFALLGYALAQSYVAGLDKAGADPTPESWVEAMKSITNLDSAQGPLDFSLSDQQGGHLLQIVEVKDNQLVYVAEGQSSTLD